MTTDELIAQLRAQKITLRAENEQLHVRGPKESLTTELRAAIAERKSEILAFLQDACDTAQPLELPISRTEWGKPLPLSFAQQRLWFLDQYEPSSSLYNIPTALRLKGRLNVETVERSLNEIVRRHESLRTTFPVVEGEPVQVIAPTLQVALPVRDLSKVSASERDSEAQRVVREEQRKPFDLSRGPLLRVLLLRLGGDDHILVLTMHHIVSDGWSRGVLYRELSLLYQAYSQGKPSPLEELLIQYAEFAVWQRQWLQGGVLEEQLSYWKKQLEGIPAVINFPTDRPRPAVQSYRGASQRFELSQELTQGLKALSTEQGLTLFMTLLAAFQILLCRYTGQSDIVVGSPIANRNRKEIEDLIGFFVNTLVLRTDLSGNPTFKELLSRVRETTLNAYTHQDLPFEKLVEELHPERNMSHSPLFQVAIVLQNAPGGAAKFTGLKVSPVSDHEETAKFDLTVSLEETAEGLKGSVQYNTDLFEQATIERLVGHYRTLLEGVVGDPDRRISELPILSEGERHQLLVGWNETEREYPKDRCSHELFETQVEETPDAIALVFEDQQLSYGELNRRANQLAHYLRKLGVGPETLVGICVERSLEMIVGLLAILKAGGAYVPLDPSFPQQRLAFMLEDTHTDILLTQASLEDHFPSFTGHRIVIDRNWGDVTQESEVNPACVISPDNLAYVIYTSGSTGKPKGVAVEHRQLMNYVKGITERLDLASQKSFATVSTLAADLGNTVIFPALTSGAALHILSQHRIADAAAMAEYLGRHAIDCLKIVPSHLKALQSGPQPERVLPCRLLILGGEASDVDWVNNLAALAPHCQIVNHYGPTETTVGVTTYAVGSDIPHTLSGHLPLGRPLANTEIYILDSNLNPVPIGVPGELYIGGLGLARGYLNRPEVTAERFIQHPFSTDSLARLYKTGDRVRYLADGNIEFLGRMDNQIKLRGYRIEPGEIEATLKQHAEVREAVVLECDGRNGQRELVAYLVVSPEIAPTLAGKPRYRLPNGVAVAQLNRNETDYIYQEIFERQAYLRHGITIHDGDCIFDVGANIGLFTVFANQMAKGLTVYCFEPNPALYDILKTNAKLYGSDVRLFKYGLSDQEKSASFTFFPGFSLLSGFYADAQAEKQVVKAYLRNQQKAGAPEMGELVEEADAILNDRFISESFDAELRALSSIIEQEQIDNIDLLKINVEKSELDVLLGISEGDWQKIRQIVLEVDIKDNLPTITSLLEQHGYEYVVEQDDLLEGTSLCYVYAIRPILERKLIREQSAGSHVRTLPLRDQSLLSAADMRAFLAAKLPDYMIPSAFMFLESLPLTPNGKVDRKALPAPDQTRPELEESFVAPWSPIEKVIAEIWAGVLKVEKVGIHDNFFDLGGHSLLATQVVSRIRVALQAELPLRVLFEAPTVAELALRIDQSASARDDLEELACNLADIESLSEEEAERELVEEDS